MGVSPTGSGIFINYTSIFSQGGNGNKPFLAVQAAAAQYSNGAFQVRGAALRTTDLLDLSPEGMAALQSASVPADAAGSDDAVAQDGAVDDVSLKSSGVSEEQRVETIRQNKNAVLAQVNALLAEKGVEVSADQTFELTAHFLDGTISVSGIDDPELASAFQEALQGDEELLALMRKTRNELGIDDQPNTVARNFTIQYGSMEETPEDAEIEFHIDVFVRRPQTPLLENDSPEAGATEESGEDGEVTFQMSIVLSNRVRSDMTAGLLEEIGSAKKSNDSAKKEKADEEESTDEEDDPIDSVSPEQEIPDEAPVLFGRDFQAFSSVQVGSNGIELNWSLLFENRNLQSIDSSSPQQVFESWSLGGTTYYAFDPESPLSIEEQATQLQSTFAKEANGLFSRHALTNWSHDFLRQSGLDRLGFSGGAEFN